MLGITAIGLIKLWLMGVIACDFMDGSSYILLTAAIFMVLAGILRGRAVLANC